MLSGIFRRYPVKVQILEKRGNALQLMNDKAARVKDKDGTQYYHLKKKKLKIKPPEYKYVFVNKKGKPILFLYSPQEGQVAPINLINPPDLQIEDKEMTFWNILQTKKTYDIYPREQSWLERHLPLVMLLIVCGTLGFITLFIMRELTGIAGAVASISAQLARTAETVGQYIPPPGT